MDNAKIFDTVAAVSRAGPEAARRLRPNGPPKVTR